MYHQLKRRFLCLKKYKCSVFCFQGILSHLASFYLQFQMHSMYVGIPVAVSQTSTYNGTVIQQCSNLILMDKFWNSKIHLSTPIIWSSGNRRDKCIFVSWMQQLSGNAEMSTWYPSPRQDPPAPVASKASMNSMLGLLPRVVITKFTKITCNAYSFFLCAPNAWVFFFNTSFGSCCS